MPGRRVKRPAGQSASQSQRDLEQAITLLEQSLDPLFAVGRYKDFFDRIHVVRASFRSARMTSAASDDLWARLNRLTETAKTRQSRDFAERAESNLTRWREQLATADRYAAALAAEVSELAARRGPAAELMRWQQRIAEKRTRLTSVESTILDLRRKIADVQMRIRQL